MLTNDELVEIRKLKSLGIRVITLRAPNDCGKTSTLKKLCQKLAMNPRVKWIGRNRYNFKHLDYSRGEIRGHFEINGIRIAVLSLGDAKRYIIENFRYCIQHQIQVVVMAVRSARDGRLFVAQKVMAEIKREIEFSEIEVWMSGTKYTAEIRERKVAEERACSVEILSLISKEVGVDVRK